MNRAVRFAMANAGRLWHPYGMEKLSPAQIKKAMASVPGWKRTGTILRRTFEFEDFVAAMKFVNAVARRAEKAGHHPDIDIRWNRVVLALTTHDAGGLTERDFDLAARLDRLVAGGR